MVNIVNVNFLTPEDTIQLVDGGRSGAMTYKVQRNNEEFFLKIFVENNAFHEINKIKKIDRIFPSNIVQLKSCGFTSDGYYTVYDYVNGVPLIEMIGKWPLNKFYEIGEKIGILHSHLPKDLDKIFINDYSIYELTEKTISQVENMMNDNPELLNIIDRKLLNKLISKFRKTCLFFDEAEKMYIHGDLDLRNVFILEDDFVLIDLDDFSIDYFVMNFKWSFAYSFKYKEYREFFKGIIHGYYGNKLPKNFYDQLMYIAILKIFDHSLVRYETKSIDETKIFLQMVVNLVKSMDLDKDDYNFLDTCVYV